MKNIIKTLLFATATTLITTPALAEVLVRYDRFNNSSTAISQITNIVGRTQPSIIFAWSNDGPNIIKQSSSSGTVLMIVSTTSSRWQYLGCKRFDMLADGKPVPLKFYKHEGDIGQGYVSEYHSMILSLRALKQIANASVVEFKYCNDEFALTPNQIKDIAEFADTVIKD